MKKIAILAPYVGKVNRGAETFVIELTKKLSKKYIIDVYSLYENDSIKSNIKKVKVKKSLIFNIHEKCFNNIRIYRKLVNKCYYLIPDVILQHKFTKKAFNDIRKTKYDLLFPNNGIWGAVYSARLRKNRKTPFIYTGHGGIGLGEKYIIEETPDAYICLTKKHLFWANEMKKSSHTNTLVIPNGVNVNDFKIHQTNKNRVKTILSVAALTDFKRHELTIKAVSKIKDVKLIILGKGEDEKKLKKLAKEYLQDRCVITSVEYENIKEYYAEADLFVLPSREEPFGIVYLEAMASNLPIVAPDDSQRREIIGDAGLFCNVEKIDEYAKTIEKALKMEWNNLPLQRVKRYDWEFIANDYERLIEKITK